PGGRSLYEVFPTRGKPFVSHDAGDLLNLVNDRHAEGMAAPLGLRRWKLLRDAAIMAILYSRAPRISDLAAMRLGEHLITRRDGSFLVRFPKEITKNHKNLEYPLDPEPTEILRDYLVHARPHLAGVSNTDQLWMGTTGGPLGLRGVEGLIKRRNLNFVGKAEGPHMARKWLADTARKRSAEAAFDAAEVAGHSPEVAVEHYHQAKDLHAGGRHGKRISRLRRRTAGLAERAFEDRELGQQKRNVE
ncbi:MAG: integrase, partial [Rubritepida sp.]|nr:integrase [Rubritepida sp.]